MKKFIYYVDILFLSLWIAVMIVAIVAVYASVADTEPATTETGILETILAFIWFVVIPIKTSWSIADYRSKKKTVSENVPNNHRSRNEQPTITNK